MHCWGIRPDPAPELDRKMVAMLGGGVLVRKHWPIDRRQRPVLVGGVVQTKEARAHDAI